MIDIKFLRENPDVVRASQKGRGENVELVDQIIAADERKRAALTDFETLRQEQNVLSKSVGAAKGDEKTALLANAKELADKVNQSSKKCGQTKIIVIDGPAGSGKTTLAKSLSRLLENCPIIHMDEIYDGWENALSPTTFSDLANWIIKPLLEIQDLYLRHLYKVFIFAAQTNRKNGRSGQLRAQ